MLQQTENPSDYVEFQKTVMKLIFDNSAYSKSLFIRDFVAEEK